MKAEHTTSNLLTVAGGLMVVSGLLMAVCVQLAYGGILWAAASCIFFTAYHFRLAENRKGVEENGESEKACRKCV